MANSPSSKKRALQAARRADINKTRRSRMRTFIRKVEEAIATGDKTAAAEALRHAQPEIMTNVSKEVVAANTHSSASRRGRRMFRLRSGCRLGGGPLCWCHGTIPVP